jgi:glutathione S-transferase
LNTHSVRQPSAASYCLSLCNFALAVRSRCFIAQWTQSVTFQRLQSAGILRTIVDSLPCYCVLICNISQFSRSSATRHNTMLELYHHGSSVCAAKARFALAEKGVVPDKLHYVDILKGEQFHADYLRINPKAVVPALVHDGNIINESTVICSYVNDAFDGPSLVPTDALSRARVRIWEKTVDEQLHPACGELTFVCCHRHIVMRLGEEGLREFLNSTPDQSVTSTWRERKRQIVQLGFEAPAIEDTIRLYDSCLHKMNEVLREHAWLAGDSFSLADIGLTPYVNRLDMLSMSGMWSGGRLPHLEAWFHRIKEMNSFEASFLEWCPRELTNDLKTFGAQSWPDVRRIIGLS